MLKGARINRKQRVRRIYLVVTQSADLEIYVSSGADLARGAWRGLRVSPYVAAWRAVQNFENALLRTPIKV